MDNNSTTVKPPVGDQDIDALIDELDGLVRKAHDAIEEMDAADRDANSKLDRTEASVDTTIAQLEKSEAELDEVEASAGNEIDKVMLDHAEDLTSE